MTDEAHMDMNPADLDLIDTVLGQIPVHLRKRGLLLGFSGGLDSTVLLHLLCRLRDLGRIGPFSAMHVHHGLQAEADRWVEHARNVTGMQHVPLMIERVSVVLASGRGIEAAAREARHAALEAGMEEGGAVFTAHHQDDQAETFMLQLMRGAGVRGLSAMPAIAPFGKGWQLRPLLGVTRERLHGYACAHGLTWIEDPSNLDGAFARNHLRNQVFPSLMEHWPQAARTLARAARRMAATESLLGDLARIDLEQARTEDNFRITVSGLLGLSDERLHNAVRGWLHELDFPAPPEPRLRELRHMLRAREDAMPTLQWAGLALRRWHGHLYAMRVMPAPGPLDRSWDAGAPLDLPELGVRIIPQWTAGRGLGMAAIQRHGLSVRLRRGGERLRLAGQPHHSSLKHLLQAAGIPPWERARMPLFFMGETLAMAGESWTSAEWAASPDEDGLSIRRVPLA